MKNNQLTAVLIAMVFVSTMFSVFMIYKYNVSIHTLQRLGPSLAGPTKAQNVMMSLFNEAAEYQQVTKNAEIVRILEGVPGAQMVKAK